MKIYPPQTPPSSGFTLPPPQQREEAAKASVFGSLGAKAPSAAGVGAADPTPPTGQMTPAQENTYYFTWAQENLSWAYYYAKIGDTADFNTYMSRLNTIAGQPGCPPELSTMLTYIAANYNTAANFMPLWTSGSSTYDDTKNMFKTATGLSLTNNGLDLCFLSFMGQNQVDPTGGSGYNFQQIQPSEAYYETIFMLAVSLDPDSSAAKDYSIDSSFWNPSGSPFPSNTTQTIVTYLWQVYCTNADGSEASASQITAFQAALAQVNGLMVQVDTALGPTSNFFKYVMNTTQSQYCSSWASVYAYFSDPTLNGWPIIGGPWLSNPSEPPFPYYNDGTTTYSLPTDQNSTPPSTFYREEQFPYWAAIVNNWDAFFQPSS